MKKKGQGISMNVIIIAALALLVLVVLSIIFLGRTGSFAEETASCENAGGSCMSDCGDGLAKLPAKNCYDSDGKIDSSLVCCTDLVV